MVEQTRLSWEDIIVVVVYFLAVIAVGLYASCKATRNNVRGYFLAGRNMYFFTVGASLFVSNIGSEHFIGLAGSGAARGIGSGAWEFNAIYFLQLLGFVFVPVYIACQTFTMPQYMTKRFGGQRIQVYYALLSLVLYIFTKCSVNLYTGALFIQQSLGWDLYLSILLQIAIVAILTVTGGLTAVIYTDTLQAMLMIGGALALTGKGFYELGGFNELWRRYPLAVTNITVPNTTCHQIDPNWNILLRDPSDPLLPWPGFLLGQTPASIWYWCSDQVIVQRALAAKSLTHAQGATILAGFAKMLPLFVLVMPGMMSRVLYTDEVGCADPDKCYEVCQSYTGCSNIAYPKLVLGIMPTGARGLMMAVLLAALMSDLDSIFNSASTMFTIDIYQRIRRNAGTKELMVVGRLFVVLIAGIAIAWVPVVKETQGGQLFVYIQEISAYLTPPIACVYLLAILWPRCNEQGAFWGLMVGLVVGGIRLILAFAYPGPSRCGDPDTRPSFIADFHYMYFAILLFWMTALAAVTISLLTKPPTYQQMYRTTFWTRFDKVDKTDLENDNVRTAWDRLKCCFKSTISAEVQTQTFDNPAADVTDDVIDEVTYFDSDCVIVTATQRDKLDVDTQAVTPAHADVTAELESNGDLSKRPPAEEGRPKSPKLTWKQFWFSWFCGISPDGVQFTEEEERVAMEREEEICSLSQDPVAKIVLHVLLVVILCIGAALYCFWSLWDYKVPA